MMRPIRTIVFLLVFLLITAFGCEKDEQGQQFTIGREASFRLHQLYTSTDGQYTLKINTINDSRCPEGVICVWAGEVTITGEVTDSGNKTPFEIHSVVTGSNQQPEGLTLKILDALPYPKQGTVTNPEDMIIVLLIDKR